MVVVEDCAAPFADLRAELLERLGPKALVDSKESLAPHLIERRGLFRGAAPYMVQPASTAEAAATVAACAKRGIAIVPQGGNTGLVGGGVPVADHPAILLNLARMNRIRSLDPLDGSMTAEAGCILQSLQEAAADVDRLFPLSLGAEGSCQLGGNISTNAGGIHVIRYGNARQLVLGLEVVLPDGRVWNGLRALRKDNRGYDLKQLFVGAEGTLGVITAAVVKLFPRPETTATALVALPSVESALAVLARCRDRSGDAVSACELMPRFGIEIASRHVAGCRDPFGTPHPWYLLVELSGGRAFDLQHLLEEVLAEAHGADLLVDAVVAQNEAQTAELWRLREGLVEAQKHEGGSIKHDISVPVSTVPAFLDRATAAVEARLPGVRPLPFGHLGDGNIHFNLSQPPEMATGEFLARWSEINRMVHDIVVDFGGSYSAEHGIGRLKVGENARFKHPVELSAMHRIKAALDPKGLMNPGVIL